MNTSFKLDWYQVFICIMHYYLTKTNFRPLRTLKVIGSEKTDPPPATFWMRIDDWGLRIGECGLRIGECRLRIDDCGLRIEDCGLLGIYTIPHKTKKLFFSFPPKKYTPYAHPQARFIKKNAIYHGTNLSWKKTFSSNLSLFQRFRSIWELVIG